MGQTGAGATPTIPLADWRLEVSGLVENPVSLTWDDFRRLRAHPGAALLALGLQAVVLPLVCVGVIAAFQLPPLYAAARPTANNNARIV